MEMLVELVRAGFHGLALAILLLGFCLLRKVVDANTGDGDGKRDDTSLLQHIRCFLIISLAFLVVGASLEVWRLSTVSEAEVLVKLSPRNLPEGVEGPDLVAGLEEYPVTGKPQLVKIKDRQDLTIGVESLSEAIHLRDGLIREFREEQGEQNDDLGL